MPVFDNVPSLRRRYFIPSLLGWRVKSHLCEDTSWTMVIFPTIRRLPVIPLLANHTPRPKSMRPAPMRTYPFPLRKQEKKMAVDTTRKAGEPPLILPADPLGAGLTVIDVEKAKEDQNKDRPLTGPLGDTTPALRERRLS